MDPIDDAIAQLLRGDRRVRDAAAFVLRGRNFDVTRLAPLLAHPHVSRQVKAIEIMRASAGITLDALVNNAAISMRGFDAHVAERTLAINLLVDPATRSP